MSMPTPTTARQQHEAALQKSLDSLSSTRKESSAGSSRKKHTRVQRPTSPPSEASENAVPRPPSPTPNSVPRTKPVVGTEVSTPKRLFEPRRFSNRPLLDDPQLTALRDGLTPERNKR